MDFRRADETWVSIVSRRGLFVAIPLILLLSGSAVAARGPYSFEDLPNDYRDEYPDWFKVSFFDLPEDLDEALAAGKQGLIVYFGQDYCPYCEALIKDNLSKPDLVRYLREHFEIVGLHTHSIEEVTSMDGRIMSMRDFAIAKKAHFTPTLLFYTKGRHLALRLVGYHPAYRMRAALEYVADSHHTHMSFAEYLELANPPPSFDAEALNPDPLFSPPPYVLDRSRFPASDPLVVVFEQPRCHACDVLHTEPLQNAVVRKRLRNFEVVQLNLWDDETPVITPDGSRVTPRKWARQLGLFYTPTLLLFDERGEEVFRVDSVVQFYRLASVLRYVKEKAYLTNPLFQVWKRERAREEAELHLVNR